MVKLSSGNDVDFGRSKKIIGQLFADSKDEITPTMQIVGLPDGYTMDFGSSVLTADGEVAFLKSDGTWNWI